PENKSIAYAKPKPLNPPVGNKYPSNAFLGSSVACPFLSVAQSIGIFSPFFIARLSFPPATTDSDISNKNGNFFEVGKPIENGLLPTEGCFAPGATINGLTFVIEIP